MVAPLVWAARCEVAATFIMDSRWHTGGGIAIPLGTVSGIVNRETLQSLFHRSIAMRLPS